MTALTALGGEVPRLDCCSDFCSTTQERLVSYMTLKATDTIALPLLPSIITHMADVQKPMCHLFSERLCYTHRVFAIGELKLQKTNKPKIEEKHYVTQVS